MKNLFALFALALLAVACEPYKYNESSTITMKKDPCYGTCPVYTFKVDGKGNAKFHGESFVTKEGAWTRHLSPVATNSLFDSFIAGNFADFADNYSDPYITDLPTTWLTFIHGSTNKTVKDYFGAPDALKELESLVEAISETDEGWVSE